MIFASLLLILVAIVLAVLGVAQGSDSLLVGSILASLLTAVFLAVSARQAAATRLAAGHQDGFLVPFVSVRRRNRDAGSAGGPQSPVGTVYGGSQDGAEVPDVRDAEPAAGDTDRDRSEAAPADVAAPAPAPTDAAPADADPSASAGASSSEVPTSGVASSGAGSPEAADSLEGPAATAAPGAAPSPGVTPGPGVVSIPSQDGPADRDNERLTPPAGRGDEFGLPDLEPQDRPTQVELDLRPDEHLAFEDLDPDEDPLDEPPAQLVPPADAALVAQLDTSVMVVDGRPRYHLVTCVHLLGREVTALPVSEAVELGFTPCNLCEPDTTLLAQVRGT